MLPSPATLPLVWVFGLISLALIGGGIYLVWAWFAGVVVGTLYLVGGLALILWSLIGRGVILLLARRPGSDEPTLERGGSVLRIRRPGGRVLHVESYGPPDAPPIVFTHGWGTNSTAWYYAKRHLADRYRVIVWDLPGLGESTAPPDGNFDLEKMADDLGAVLTEAAGRPALLVGHSIGGMILQTFCRLYPERAWRQVRGLVLVNTTYTNPVKTTTFSAFFRAIQKPVLEPILHLTVWLSPVVWLMDWLAYLNGTTHLAAMIAGFAGRETRGQLDLAARYNPLASPAVRARGALAMLRFDETATLPTIRVPTLVLVGHLDRMTIPEAGRTIGAVAPNAEVVTLAPAGHMSVFEQNRALTAAIDAFAAQVHDRVPLSA